MRKVAFDYMWKWESSVSLPAALVIVSDVSCGRCIKSYNLSLQRAVLNGFRIVLSPCDKHRATSGTAALRSVWPIEADAPAQEFHCRGGREDDIMEHGVSTAVVQQRDSVVMVCHAPDELFEKRL